MTKKLTDIPPLPLSIQDSWIHKCHNDLPNNIYVKKQKKTDFD